MSVDIIYVPFKKTECSHNEIRITLRSIERNCKNAGNLYILGEDYGFYSDKVKFIESNFDVSDYKYPVVPIKSFFKLIKDNYEELSDEVCLITDNCVINSPMDLKTFPNYWKYPLENCGLWTSKKYANMETDSFFATKYLAEGRHMNYETTFPLRISKEKILATEDIIKFADSQSRGGIMLRSFLANYWNIGDEQLNDEKKYGIDAILEVRDLVDRGFPVIGMSSQLWSVSGFSYFVKQYPNRCSYENFKVIL